jgi:glycerol uptake facilitator-like aquaporin
MTGQDREKKVRSMRTRALVAGFLGTALLLATVVGSGIMGDRLSGGNIAIALLANPAVTIARALTDTFAGIRPADVPGFVVAQTIGAAAATMLCTWLVPTLPATAREIVVPHTQEAEREQVEWIR